MKTRNRYRVRFVDASDPGAVQLVKRIVAAPADCFRSDCNLAAAHDGAHRSVVGGPSKADR